jgi:hypothetical protein
MVSSSSALVTSRPVTFATNSELQGSISATSPNTLITLGTGSAVTAGRTLALTGGALLGVDSNAMIDGAVLLGDACAFGSANVAPAQLLGTGSVLLAATNPKVTLGPNLITGNVTVSGAGTLVLQDTAVQNAIVISGPMALGEYTFTSLFQLFCLRNNFYSPADVAGNVTFPGGAYVFSSVQLRANSTFTVLSPATITSQTTSLHAPAAWQLSPGAVAGAGAAELAIAVNTNVLTTVLSSKGALELDR